MILDFVILVLTSALIWILFEFVSKRNAPPGPIRLPIVGALPQVIRAHSQAHLALQKLSKKYGEVMQIKLGSCEIACQINVNSTVVISSYEAAKTICNKDSVVGRFLNSVLAIRNFGKPIGIVFSSGEFWKTTKRFVVRNLRDFGFGNSRNMETVIHEQADELIQRMSVGIGCEEILDSNKCFSIPVVNVLWGMVTGETFPQDSEKLLKLLEIQEKVLKSGDFASGIGLSFPFLAHWFPGLTGTAEYSMMQRCLQTFVKEMMDSHKEKLKSHSQPTCFIERLLLEIQRNEALANSEFTEEHGIIILMDLLVAGTESSSSNLGFLILYTLIFSSVQAKIHEEIDRVLENGRQPTLEEMNRFPYIRAVILEVFRHASVVQFTPPRTSSQDINYNGAVIKAGVPILVNLFTIHHDEKLWKDPWNFRPERFLSTNGQLDQQLAERVVIFGFGHRLCLGQRFAESIIFLFFTKLCQTFEFLNSPGEKVPTLEPKVGFTLSPQPYRIILKKR